MKRFVIAGLSAMVVLSSGCKAPEQGLRAPPEGAALPPGPLRLDFKPAAGKTLTERTLTTRTERFTAQNVKKAPFREGVEATLRSRFEPAAGGGWKLSQQVSAVRVKNDDTEVKNKLTDLVERFPLEVQVSSDGTFVRLLNPEAAEQAVRAVFNQPGEAEAMLPYFAPQALEEQARREWDSKYGGLFNRTLAPGQTAFYGLESVGLTSGTQLSYGVERKVVGRVKTAYGSALLLELRCLGAPAGPGKEALEKLMAEREVDALEPSVRCEGRQEVVGEPFAPVRTELHLTATPKGPDGSTPVEILLDKTVTLERAE